MTEQWKPLKDYEHLYEVSDRGHVRKALVEGSYYLDGKPCRIQTDRSGRRRVKILYQGRTQKVNVARLVAETFLPNPDGLKYVKHLNGDLRDDCVENLVWSSSASKVYQPKKEER